MALYKLITKQTTITEGIAEAESKEIIETELDSNSMPTWWAIKSTKTESIDMVELVELEPKSG